MSLCKLTQNILNNMTDDCYLNSPGIEDYIYVYNIGDIESLEYKDENRYDNSAFVTTIVTGEPFYTFELVQNTAEYETEIDDESNLHNQTFTASVYYNEDFEIILRNASKNGKFVVVFKPKGEDNYRMFGWKNGASMTYATTANNEQTSYDITFNCVSDFSTMAVDGSNFNLDEKFFNPIFIPDYSQAYCEVDENLENTGYLVAEYVLKVNSAGEALDVNNQLCQYTGRLQDAYYYNVITPDTTTYHILGSYDDTAEFDGKPVKVYDTTHCTVSATNTIQVSPSVVNLNSTSNTYATVAITTENLWQVRSIPSSVSVSPISGDGDGTITIMSRGNGVSSDVIKVKNRITNEEVSVTVNINVLKVGDNNYTYGNAGEYLIPVSVEPSGTYTIAIGPNSNGITADIYNESYMEVTLAASEFTKNWTLTLTHSNDPNEIKRISVTLIGSGDTSPNWVTINSYCEDI